MTENDLRCSLLFTSPPYFGVTHYHKDQWLRLWLLGGEELPLWTSEQYKGRFESKPKYYDMLDSVFCTASEIMSDKATVYIRTDSREYTLATTLDVLDKHFAGWSKEVIQVPSPSKTQTTILGNRSNKPGDVDIILYR